MSPEELEEWLDRWDDAALLFLRSISKVSLLDQESAPTRQLTISRYDAVEVLLDELNPSRRVSRQRVEAADGRSWVVYSAEAPTPTGVFRARKATQATTPVAIALSPVRRQSWPNSRRAPGHPYALTHICQRAVRSANEPP